MNVGFGTVAVQFLFWEYLFQIFGIVSLQCTEVKFLHSHHAAKTGRMLPHLQYPSLSHFCLSIEGSILPVLDADRVII
jgi:hypothetical protein